MLILFLHKFLRENDSEKNRFALDIDFNSATEYAIYTPVKQMYVFWAKEWYDSLDILRNT